MRQMEMTMGVKKLRLDANKPGDNSSFCWGFSPDFYASRTKFSKYIDYALPAIWKRRQLNPIRPPQPSKCCC